MTREPAMWALLVVALTGGNLAAQITDQERRTLRGLTTVEVLVEGLSPDAAACNVGKESLELAVARPLVDAGLKLSKSDTYVYANATVLRTSGSGLCVASYEVALRTPVMAPLGFQRDGQPLFLTVQLWQNAGILTGTAATFGERLLGVFRELADRLATKVKIANTP